MIHVIDHIYKHSKKIDFRRLRGATSRAPEKRPTAQGHQQVLAERFRKSAGEKNKKIKNKNYYLYNIYYTLFL
jgi:hypothetical protein